MSLDLLDFVVDCKKATACHDVIYVIFIKRVELSNTFTESQSASARANMSALNKMLVRTAQSDFDLKYSLTQLHEKRTKLGIILYMLFISKTKMQSI